MSTATPEELRALLREAQNTGEVSPEVARIRLALLRAEIPQALVQIDSVRADDTAIAIKATVGLPGGARHSHIASADVNADAGWSDQLVMVQAQATIAVLDGLQRSAPKPTAESTTTSNTTPPRRPAAPKSGEDDHLPEYSWNAFWQSMNQRGISREQVEQALGKSVQEATPREALDALKSAGILE